MADQWRSRTKTYHASSRPFSKAPYKPMVHVTSVPAPPLGQLIQSLGKDVLEKDAKDSLEEAKIQNCDVVASYNWLDKTDPAIILPGKPPRWTPLPVATTLPQDAGVYSRDKNGSKYPSHLMESTVLAALTADPHLPADLDVVACYSSFGNLLRFLLGEDKSFRILVQAVGYTVFFVRRENSPTERIENIRGNGHTFPEAYTTWDREVKGSASSHRILKYSFGGLRMLVRAEIDAYVPDLEDVGKVLGTGHSRASEGRIPTAAPTTVDIGDLEELLSSLGHTTAVPTLPPTAKIDVTRQTTLDQVPQSQLLEIKTRGQWKRDKEDTVMGEMPKLWLAQIPNVVVAYHKSGRYEADIPVQNVKPRVEQWERLAKRELSCLAAMLHKVVGIVRAREDKKLELCRSGIGKLEIREQLADAGELLSEEMKVKWKEGGVVSRKGATINLIL